MKRYKPGFFILSLAALTLGFLPLPAPEKGARTITVDELRYHLEFLGATEFRGRETPSPELEIATLYLGNWARHAGLKPILPDGSFFQTIPISVTRVVEPHTRLLVSGRQGDRIFYYGKSFAGDFSESGSFCGPVVFAGLGISDPSTGRDDLQGLDLAGKVVVILDAQPLAYEYPLGSTYSFRLFQRIAKIREQGAAAVLSIVTPERAELEAQGMPVFDDIPAGRMDTLYESQRRGAPARPVTDPIAAPARPPLPFAHAQVSHEAAAAIMGVNCAEIGGWYRMIEKGESLPHREITGSRVRLDVEVEKTPASTRSVIAQVPGSDPRLRHEYIVVCAHHDHLGIGDGEIIPGADDNATGTVALMEIAQALLVEKPKRTVILAWFTGEERGYIGSQHFVNNCPVPLEKVSACLNLDMLGRNGVDHLYLVGSDLLSSELDGAIRKVNRRSGLDFRFDYLYSNLTHPQRVYFRSDHYPHVRFGIPSVWFFCGFTPDYHTSRDVLSAIDYRKLLRCTRLVYLTTLEIGNRQNLLKLDVNPEVTSRGKHNLTVRSLFQNNN